MDFVNKFIEYLSVFIALLVVLPLHEFAHAFVAVKSGDITPKLYNRYTLNPFAHFDPLGLCCLVLVHFGWAKPMPVNPNNFKHYKRDCFFVSVAGVLMNYITAFICFPLMMLSFRIPDFGYFTAVLQFTLYYIVSLSLVLFVFNLIPVYPLDGFMAIDVFSKKRSSFYYFLRNYGIYVLYALFALSFISDITGIQGLDILGTAINFIVGYISVPISAFWGLFF